MENGNYIFKILIWKYILYYDGLIVCDNLNNKYILNID
jgi:hypothetical protein